MKVFVMRVGEGFALPVPAHLAAQLELRPGDEADLEGPDEDGTLRYVIAPATRSEAAVVSPSLQASESEDSTETDLPSPDDVVQAVSPGKGSTPPSPPPTFEGEVERLLKTHAAAMREVDR